MKVALFHGRGAISALIRWQTRGEYSHAAVVLDDGRVIEAWQGDGVRVLPGLKHGTAGVDFFTVAGVTVEQQAKVVEFLTQQVGKGYDYVGVLRFVSRRKNGSSARWFCSELVFAAFQHAGVPLLARTEAWEVSPSLLARAPRLINN